MEGWTDGHVACPRDLPEQLVSPDLRLLLPRYAETEKRLLQPVHYAGLRLDSNLNEGGTESVLLTRVSVLQG